MYGMEIAFITYEFDVSEWNTMVLFYFYLWTLSITFKTKASLDVILYLIMMYEWHYWILHDHNAIVQSFSQSLN